MKAFIIVLQTLAVTFPTGCLCAQQASEDAIKYFNAVRAGERPTTPKLHAEEVCRVIKPFLTDSTAVVRIKARELLLTAAASSANVGIQSRAIEDILAATEQSDVTATGIVIPMIKTFEVQAFNDSSKKHVRRLIKAKDPHISEWIMIAGFLQLKELENDIRAYSLVGNPQSRRWSALLSLARMGDSGVASEVIGRVKKLGVSDDVVYKLFPDLLYTRSHAAIAYMVEVLHQDEKNCISADVEKQTPIPCGYRIMEQLAPVVEGFPVTLGLSGDLDVEDYSYALSTVREWFRVHKSYSINNNRY